MTRTMGNGRSHENWVVRGSVAGLLVVLCFLTGFSVITQEGVAQESKRADTATRLSAIYQDARHWVTEAKSVERRYRFEGSYTVRLSHRAGDRPAGGRPAQRRATRSLARQP